MILQMRRLMIKTVMERVYIMEALRPGIPIKRVPAEIRALIEARRFGITIRIGRVFWSRKGGFK